MLRNLVQSTAASFMASSIHGRQESVRTFGTKVKFKPAKPTGVARSRESTDHTFFILNSKALKANFVGSLKTFGPSYQER
jgi:hypothetical protein